MGVEWFWRRRGWWCVAGARLECWPGWGRGGREFGRIRVGQKALVWMVVSASRLAMEATGQVGRIKAAAGNSACDGSSRGEG